MHQEMLFRGQMRLGADADPLVVELWRTGDTVVAFGAGNATAGVLKAAVIDLDDGRRLTVRGNLPDGAGPAMWVGAEPAREVGRWSGMNVQWPDGQTLAGSDVTWTQYAVTIQTPGQVSREIAGARTEAIGSQRWIVAGAGVRILADPGSGGCGCGGKR